MKKKSVQNCRFVHYAKFHCIVTTLNRLFKIEFERGVGTGKEPKTKYVCHGLISLYVNFHNNRTMWSTYLLVKICRWGGKEKEPKILF